MSSWRTLTLSIALLSGCGSIVYDDGSEPHEVVDRRGGAAYLITQPAPPGPYVTVLPPEPQPQPTPTYPAPAYAPVSPAPAYGSAARHCAAGQLRIVNEVVDGRSGPAVIASGHCRVIIDEAIIRGQPAIVLTDGARVDITESRIQGDIHQTSSAQLHMRGSTHESGRIVRR